MEARFGAGERVARGDAMFKDEHAQGELFCVFMHILFLKSCAYC